MSAPNVETLQRLAAVIDGYFKPSFLFDVYHSAWRQRVSPAEDTVEYEGLARTDDGAVVPPVVRFGSIAAYDDVQSAARNARGDAVTGDMTEEELFKLVKDAVTSYAKLITFVEDAALGPCVRRNAMLSEDDNPIQRSVHMKPVHYNATEEDIRGFVVGQFAAKILVGESNERLDKLIVNVSKRTMVDVSANGVSRTVHYAQIEFIKKDIALLFVKTKPTYTASDALLQHYLPLLKVKMLVDHMKEYEDIETRREAERNRNQLFRAAQAQEQREETRQIVEAKLNAATAASSSGATVQVTEQFLTPGKTLKVPSLPPNVSWRDIKVKLSNLFPGEKRLIRVVKEHEGAAFIVLFSPEKLQPLLSAWAADTFCHNVVPSLVKVEGDEEKWAMKEYPSWVSGFVTHKVVKNAKCAAKRLRDE